MTLARRVASALACKTKDEDVQLMLRASEDPSLAMHAAAVSALAAQQHTEVLPAVLRLSDETGRGITRALLYRAFVALPYAATRATATEWLTGGDRTRRGAAANAMGAHAIADDVRLVAAELFSRARSRTEWRPVRRLLPRRGLGPAPGVWAIPGARPRI